MDKAEYDKLYYKKNAERIKARVLARHARIKDDPDFKAKVKAQRERTHFGIPRSVVFRKTDGKCFYCGGDAQVVHHLDDDGRGNENSGREPGTDPARLVPACRACHLDIHRNKMMLVKKTRANGYWSRNYDCCVECGTTKRKHNSRGLCVNCYARRRNKGGGV